MLSTPLTSSNSSMLYLLATRPSLLIGSYTRYPVSAH
jgi:hypothetical protein